ncbi:hypothetical protein AT00_14225 [Pseudoalteromonas lipolytica SCSIO 04301]|uniref:hypothetical protein n=1 Tax=Pseudoalteromonas lipolytica TaxID=570156 RepID=UPI0004517DFB|nr:hypothetical protein [Pseudoalteromonas lipolytica]EWH05772.1 hypothetical protein AT00_14225 [Pseudoalteromonas lipolytica SCSIO 04301]
MNFLVCPKLGINYFKLQNTPAAEYYRGCGKAWIAIANGIPQAIKYMDDFAYDPDLEASQREQFGVYRQKCRDYLSSKGRIESGHCSCWEFTTNAYYCEAESLLAAIESEREYMELNT